MMDNREEGAHDHPHHYGGHVTCSTKVDNKALNNNVNSKALLLEVNEPMTRLK